MKTEIEIPFPTPLQAKQAEKILQSERRNTERSKAKISAKASSLHLSIHASDLAALRAALNTYLRLLSVIKTVSK